MSVTTRRQDRGLNMSVIAPAAPSPSVMAMRGSPEALAYLAGILDGEGCLRITRQRLRRKPLNSPRHWATVFVGNTSWLLVDSLRRRFGGCIYRRAPTVTKRAVYLWQLTTREAVLGILTAVRPYLLVKTAQADLLIEFITGLEFGRGRGPGGGRGRFVSPAELARRERIYEQVRELNHAVQSQPARIDRRAA